MTCKSVQSKLSAYIDGELSGFEMLDMRSHLHSCSKCFQEADQLRKLKSILGNMTESAPDEEFVHRLRERVFSSASPTLARKMPLAMISGMAFVTALLLSLAALRSRTPGLTGHIQIKQAVVQPNFDLARDQAWQSGGDSLSDESFIITASTNGAH